MNNNTTRVGCIMVTSYCSSKNIQVRNGQFFCTHFACHIHSKIEATSHTYKHEWISHTHTLWNLNHLNSQQTDHVRLQGPVEHTDNHCLQLLYVCLWFGHLYHLLVTCISKTEHFSTCCTALVNYDTSYRFCIHDW